MAKKYYAVKSGRAPGIYETWDDCKKQVMGYSSAVYKSFTSLADAQEFMKGASAVAAGAAPKDDTGRVICYVDGSFDKRTGRFSYGVVVLKDEGNGNVAETAQFNKAFDEPDMAEMRNVSGEIYGSMAAMKWCLDNGVDDVVIYYDYEGIAKWALREWKANKKGTQAYVAYYDSIKDKLSVEFRKVKGHSGDKYNDMVDALAKSALGLL